jgi:iron-sulfur cluster repair protein YtfE (RIC family)
VDPELGPRLQAEHEEIESQFDVIRELARLGDWHALYDEWQPFTARLERHMRFEETELFPALEERRPDAAPALSKLRAKHDELRDQVFRLSLDLELKHFDPASVDGLLANLREHATRESEILYPALAELKAG